MCQIGRQPDGSLFSNERHHKPLSSSSFVASDAKRYTEFELLENIIIFETFAQNYIAVIIFIYLFFF